MEERFLVTEYFPGGSLSKRPDIFKGDPLRAIKAFKVLAEGVKQIHDQGAIHRDIKPENIFVSESGSLVLGDFGIVIFKNDDRLTARFERAGTRYWMAPWVDRKNRISLDKIDATLDIYPLGKLLWSMISGEDMLPREDFEDHEYNLEALFLDTPREMRRINELLKKCVVDKREKCLPSVDDLLSEIERIESPLAGKREGNIKNGLVVFAEWANTNHNTPRRHQITFLSRLLFRFIRAVMAWITRSKYKSMHAITAGMSNCS